MRERYRFELLFRVEVIVIILTIQCIFSSVQALGATEDTSMECAGISVIPHTRAPGIRYSFKPESADGVYMELFMRNSAPQDNTAGESVYCSSVLFNGDEPQTLINKEQWSWHDTPNQWNPDNVELPPGGIFVWPINTISDDWGIGSNFEITVTDWENIDRYKIPVTITNNPVVLKTLTFLAPEEEDHPNRIVFHVVNASEKAWKIRSLRIYLPAGEASPRVFMKEMEFTGINVHPESDGIPPGAQACADVSTSVLPLSPAVIEIGLASDDGDEFSIWCRRKIFKESFMIGADWNLDSEPALKKLQHPATDKQMKRMHINTIYARNGLDAILDLDDGIAELPYALFGVCTKTNIQNKDSLCANIAGIQPIDEPQNDISMEKQYPQSVLYALSPYSKLPFPTSITLTDESYWFKYAGLSDLPVLKSPRIMAHTADAWERYKRWEEPVPWGAPLETFGALTRNLRNTYQPRPIAVQVQGPATGMLPPNDRKRAAPSPSELRVTAYHALSSRITGILWQGLDVQGLVEFRDLIEPITKINREIMLLKDFYMEGAPYRFNSTTNAETGLPEWSLSIIAAPRAALMFAVDLNYKPSGFFGRQFQFDKKRKASFKFPLPGYLRKPVDVFRVDSEGLYLVDYRITDDGVEISDEQSKVAVYIAAQDLELRPRLVKKLKALVDSEHAVGFDPANERRDFSILKGIIENE
ncbi:MAG: hypothetical protein K9N52_00435 [Verrucomicrobia bacterium]|nr:hypothetical protein [Verrucomicrobiota bacterium]